MPLTPVQRVYWDVIAKENAHRSPFRNIAASLRLSGPLDIHRLEQSIQTVVNRHESLRTRMAHFELERQPTQVIDPPDPVRLTTIDLSQSNANAEEAARQLGSEFLSEGIDLRTHPVFDARLLKLSASEHVLMLALDHIASDATSYPILTREVISNLRNDFDSRQTAASALRIQFPDYAVWHHRTDGAWRQQNEAYWCNKLSQVAKVVIPADRELPRQAPVSSEVVHVPFGKRLTALLRDTSRREHCLMPLLLLGIYLVAISEWCERNDLLINFISHGRHGFPELKDMVGCIAHPVFMRVEVNPQEHLRDLVGRIMMEFYSSVAHDASHVLAVPDDLTEVFFNWLPAEWGVSGTFPSAVRPAEDPDSDLRIQSFPLGKPIVEKFAPLFTDTPSGVLAMIWYNGELFLRSTMERFAARMMSLVERVAQDPDTALTSGIGA